MSPLLIRAALAAVLVPFLLLTLVGCELRGSTPQTMAEDATAGAAVGGAIGGPAGAGAGALIALLIGAAVRHLEKSKLDREVAALRQQNASLTGKGQP